MPLIISVRIGHDEGIYIGFDYIYFLRRDLPSDNVEANVGIDLEISLEVFVDWHHRFVLSYQGLVQFGNSRKGKTVLYSVQYH